MSTAFKRGRSPNTVLSQGASSVSGSAVSNNRQNSAKKQRRPAALRNNDVFNNSANERSEGRGNSEEILVNNRRGVRTAATGAAANVFGQVRPATSPKTRPKTPLQKQKNKSLKPQATISKSNRSIQRTAAQGAAAAAIEKNRREKRLKNLISLRNKLPNVLKAKHTNAVLNRMSTMESMTAIHLKMMQTNLNKAKSNQVKKPVKSVKSASAAKSVKSTKSASVASAAKSANAATKSPNKPANSRRNSVTTLPSARGIVVNNANSNFSGKGKEGILKVIKNLARNTQKRTNSYLSGLMPQIPVNSIKEYYAYAYAILYDMVDMIDATKLKDVSVEATFIQEIHKRIMRLNEYSSGRSTNSLGDRREFTFELKDDDVVEFLFLMWLDGSHDEYFKNLSFKDFLNSAFCTNFFKPDHIQLAQDFVTAMPDATKIFNNNNNARLNSIIKKYKDKTKFKKDKADLFNGKFKNRFSTILNICIEAESVWFFIHKHNPQMFKDKGKVISVSKKILDKGYKTLKDTFEKVLKTNIDKLLGVKTSNIGIKRTGLSSELNSKQTRLVSLDYQSPFGTIDAFINKTSQFRPYVTAGNMIDAGKHMLKSSVYKDDIAMLTRVLRTKKPEIMNNKNNAALEAHYHVGPLNFSIKNNNKDFFKVNLNIRKEGPSNNTNNTYSGDFFDLKINDKAVLIGATAKNAGGRGANNQSNASPQAMMGKFMGDALQYMVVAIQNKYRGKNRIFGSGDGSACFMYVYMCKKLDIPPRLLVDVGGSNKIVTYVGLNSNNKQRI
jgi:hypothetical protein